MTPIKTDPVNPCVECPHCGTTDMPLRQGPNLFLCVYCHCLYSAIEMVTGVATVAIYEAAYTGDAKFVRISMGICK